MKKYFFFMFYFISVLTAYSETNRFNIDRISFFISPKLLKDGSITDIGIGFNYTKNLSGNLHFRSTMISKNEELQNVSDSLNAVNENIYEIYLTPIEYSFLNNSNTNFKVGGGIYYQYSKLNEKGFFNMPILESLTPPKERVNSYTNDFSMHLLGPLVELGLSYNSDWFSFSLYSGITPIFFLNSSQEMKIEPLLVNNADYSQNTCGSPYFYAGIDSIILKYINLVILYDFAKLNYKTIDFDSSLNWINPERDVTIQSLKLEASLKIPLGNLFAQIGYGYTFDFTKFNNDPNIIGNKQYVIFTAKNYIKEL